MPYYPGQDDGYVHNLNSATNLAKSLFGDPALQAKAGLAAKQGLYYEANAGKATQETADLQQASGYRNRFEGMSPGAENTPEGRQALGRIAMLMGGDPTKAVQALGQIYALGNPDGVDQRVLDNSVVASGHDFGGTQTGFYRSDATDRRGQDITSADTQRGQNITSGDNRAQTAATREASIYGSDRHYAASTENSVRDNTTSRSNNTDNNAAQMDRQQQLPVSVAQDSRSYITPEKAAALNMNAPAGPTGVAVLFGKDSAKAAKPRGVTAAEEDAYVVDALASMGATVQDAKGNTLLAPGVQEAIGPAKYAAAKLAAAAAMNGTGNTAEASAAFLQTAGIAPGSKFNPAEGKWFAPDKPASVAPPSGLAAVVAPPPAAPAPAAPGAPMPLGPQASKPGTAARPQGMSDQQVIDQANASIQKGANPEAVRKRLEGMGIQLNPAPGA